MKDIAEEIEKSEFVIIPNSGHMPNMEQPEIFNHEKRGQTQYYWADGSN